MVKRTKEAIADEKENFNKNRTSKITDYNSQKTSSSKITDNNSSDDLIRVLANAYENKRSRQVFKWEKIQRKAFYKTA